MEEDERIARKFLRLDASALHASTPLKSPRYEWLECTSLDVSSNGLSSLPHAKAFPCCHSVDISDNGLGRLSSLLPLARHLIHLNASKNGIKDLSCLSSFTQLVHLKLACNLITELPTLDATRLTLLDLGSNSLTALPNLLPLRSLQVLNLSRNKLSSLEDAPHLFPHSITNLNVAWNEIERLSSFFSISFLPSLSSVSVGGNPCVHSAPFNYRPFLFALSYNSLVEVDGIHLSDEEIIKGEFILQDKICKFKRLGLDGERGLREYLSDETPPIDAVDMNSSFDDRLLKVLHKRREYSLILSPSRSDREREEGVSVSPFSAWTRPFQGPFLPSETATSLDGMDEEEKENNPPSTASTLREDTVEELDVVSREEATPVPIALPRQPMDVALHRAATKIQRWWKTRAGPTPRSLCHCSGDLDDLRSENHVLREAAMAQLQCTEKMETLLRQLQRRVEALEVAMAPSAPSNLRLEGETGEGVRVEWKAPAAVDYYEVVVDGRESGRIRGTSSSCILRIPEGPAKIQLRSVRGGVSSALSLPLQFS